MTKSKIKKKKHSKHKAFIGQRNISQKGENICNIKFIDYYLCKTIATFFNKSLSDENRENSLLMCKSIDFSIGRVVIAMAAWFIMSILSISIIINKYYENIISNYILNNYWVTLILGLILGILLSMRYNKYTYYVFTTQEWENLRIRYYSIKGKQRKIRNFWFYVIFIGIPILFFTMVLLN